MSAPIDLAAMLLKGDRLLTPAEVARLFRVDPKTVTRWAAAGKLNSTRTLGGHRRFLASDVRALLEADFTPAQIQERAAAAIA
jgi:excisionase family DNA binding protein